MKKAILMTTVIAVTSLLVNCGQNDNTNKQTKAATIAAPAFAGGGQPTQQQNVAVTSITKTGEAFDSVVTLKITAAGQELTDIADHQTNTPSYPQYTYKQINYNDGGSLLIETLCMDNDCDQYRILIHNIKNNTYISQLYVQYQFSNSQVTNNTLAPGKAYQNIFSIP